MQKNILITGLPRSGKTSLVERVIADIPNKVGFVTREIRANGQRTGFEIETHLGNRTVLASLNFKTHHQVSKYFVRVENLDSVIPEVSLFAENDILYLDEIGQMELLSEKFQSLVTIFLDSQNTVIATASLVYQDTFLERIKGRSDVIWVDITPENRGVKERFVKLLVNKIEKARLYARQRERFTRTSHGVKLDSEHGTRILIPYSGKWECDCDFFHEYKICSHSIAAAVVAT